MRNEEELRELMYQALASLGKNPRSYAQRVLIFFCEELDQDPEDWTAYPDVLAQVRAHPDEGGEPDVP